jgi:hypothetical protein
MAQNNHKPSGVAMPTTAFASVKLPAALVNAARESATPMRRSIASQIEYWSTLGQVVEQSGLSAQEAKAAIQRYDAASRAPGSTAQLDAIASRFAAAEQTGSLASQVRQIVLDNRAKVAPLKRAA